jgi:peroxiredoxin
MKTFLFICLVLCSLQLSASVNIDHINAVSLSKKTTENLSLKGDKATVVIFLSKDCPCSKGNLDYINQLSQEFKNFRFIGIHSKLHSTVEDVQNYLQDKKLNFEVYNDNDLKIADQFKALKTPHAFIVSTNGDVVYNGGITNTTFPRNAKEFFLKDALTNIENHKLPAKAETRTLGCFILR